MKGFYDDADSRSIARYKAMTMNTVCRNSTVVTPATLLNESASGIGTDRSEGRA